MKHITQEDIARLLGVTRITVSKALRDHPDISASTKTRVKEAADTLGYSPNEIARQLTSRQTHSIGVVVPDLENRFFSHVVNSIVDEANRQGYQILLTVSRESEKLEQQNLLNLLGQRVDGLLVCLSQQTADRKIFERIRRMEIPLLFFDRTFLDSGFSSVVFNDEAGMHDCIDRLVELGYRSMGHLAGYSHTSVGLLRHRAFREALKRHQMEIREEWILEGGFEFSDGFNGWNRLMKCGTMPDVMIAVNDRVAFGAMKAMAGAGVSVPRQVGLVGFGFQDHSAYEPCLLSMVLQDPRMMGREAARCLIEDIHKVAPESVLVRKLDTSLSFQHTTQPR